MSIAFRTGAEEARKSQKKGSFEYGALPDAEKERLCRALLSEFGVMQITTSDTGELRHNCSLPWHNETHPSASLNYKKLTYKCYGCDSSGGLLWYIGTCRGESGELARKWLNDQTGLGADEQPLSALLDFFDAVYGTEAEQSAPIPKMSAQVLSPWMVIHPYLTDPKSEGGRGIPEETIIRFRVGYGTLRLRLGDRWVDSNRIVIPHFWRGDLVGWQSRRLYNDGTGKYQSSPEFPKDSTLYFYDPRSRMSVVVESPMSVLSKAHLPFHVESTFGASVTDKQCRHLTSHDRVILWMDNDDAGWGATERLIEALEPYSQVYVVDSPWAADPADLDDNTYIQLVEAAVPSSLWNRPRELMPWG